MGTFRSKEKNLLMMVTYCTGVRETPGSLYSGETEKALKRQGYKCGQCGLYLDGKEKI